MSHKVSYSKLFTPPKFLEMPAVSLEVQPTRIVFLLARNNEKGLIPEIYGYTPIPEGCVSQGEVIKREPIIKALIDIRKKTRVSFARFSISEDKSYVFRTKLPNLEQKEIRNIIDFKIEENVPLTSKEAVFDYDIINSSKSSKELDVVVSVASLSIIQEWQDVFELAGLTPTLFSPESNNIAKSVIKDSNEQVIVIVNIRESSIILSLAISGVVCQTSAINFGSSAFTDSLAKYFKVSKEEALKIKNDKLYTDSAESMEIFSYLINTISAVKDEIYKFVSYCNEREDVVGQVDRIILCGRDSMIIGLEKYLEMNLNMEVSVANIWVNNFDLEVYVPETNKIDSMDQVVVNGLSLF